MIGTGAAGNGRPQNEENQPKVEPQTLKRRVEARRGAGTLLAPAGCQGVLPGGCSPPLPQGARGLGRARPVRASFHLVVASLGEELKIWNKHTLTFWWDSLELSYEAFSPRQTPRAIPQWLLAVHPYGFTLAPGSSQRLLRRVGQKGRRRRSRPWCTQPDAATFS